MGWQGSDPSRDQRSRIVALNVPRGTSSVDVSRGTSSDKCSRLTSDRVRNAFDLTEIITALSFEPDCDAACTNARNRYREPLRKIERRTRHRSVVVMSWMILETYRKRVEVRKLKLPSRGSQECVLLVDRLKSGKAAFWQANRSDDHRKSTAGANIENSWMVLENRYDM